MPKGSLTDLHAATQTKDQVESGFLLNVVIREGTAVLELLPSKDQALLVRRNSFLVLDLGLDVIDGVARFNFKRNGLARHWSPVSIV